jgi:hypothetical protein
MTGKNEDETLINLRVKRKDLPKYKLAAKRLGTSMSAILLSALNQAVGRANLKQYITKANE